MARDYEDINNIDQLDGRDLRDTVREHLAAHNGLDIDDITVQIEGETLVVLTGRVGTEGERRVAEHILTDQLGIQDFRNDLVIDPIRRAESPTDIDDLLVEEEREDGVLLGDRPVPFTDESAHLADVAQDDLDGSTDMQNVMEDGETWIPPESPTPEGMSGTDAGPEELGGQH
ncbi:MAG: BON domain-containing protein [bacterium]